MTILVVFGIVLHNIIGPIAPVQDMRVALYAEVLHVDNSYIICLKWSAYFMIIYITSILTVICSGIKATTVPTNFRSSRLSEAHIKK